MSTIMPATIFSSEFVGSGGEPGRRPHDQGEALPCCPLGGPRAAIGSAGKAGTVPARPAALTLAYISAGSVRSASGLVHR